MDPTAVLRDVFGHAAFRGGQREAIDAVLAGRDALVLQPTGAGKSACYQVPAVALARAGHGTTIVISPLIALMNDQVRALVGRGVAAAALHSQLDDDDRLETLRRLMAGELELLYLSPERAVLDGFRRLLGRARVALLAIDEAHCVSQWGHDFRPEYLRLGELREICDGPAIPMIALTATATPRVMAEIASSLELRTPVTVRGDFHRPNLAFEVIHVPPGRGEETRLAAMIAALERLGLRDQRDRSTGRAIIYCATRKTAETVADHLKAAGFAAGYYHAGRTARARDRAQTGFSLGRTRVLVATNAFGMGIDYPDIRAIVHYQAPGSLEAYYQEAGRAGRDGDPSTCLLLFGRGDLMTQRRISQSNSSSAKVEARREEALAAVGRYANAWTCRQQILCAHFTGTEDHAACTTCDACRDPQGASIEPLPAPAAALDDASAQIILAAMTAHDRPVGKGNLAKALRGSQAKPIVIQGLVRLPQHGALASASEDAIVATIDRLVADLRLVRKGRKYPMVALPGPPKVTRTTYARRGRDGTSTSSITVELDRYRRSMARKLKWKAYMVFQKATMVAIDEKRPDSLLALQRIPGLGLSRIERFGADVLAIVKRYTVS
ncbi:MAG: ATP-dependent DNA helicase [Proteobacteria bacterium]|nr:ATP-dependent DNA helicase [Pseudomonadota bacterium]